MQAQVLEPARATSREAGPWRDGRALVARLGEPLPPTCVLTGVRTDSAEDCEVEVAPALVRWISAACMFVQLQELLTRTVEMSLPLTADRDALRTRARRRGAAWIAVGLAIATAFFVVDLAAARWLAFAPVLVLLAVARGACLVARPLALPHGVRRRGDVVWLRGVHPDALAGLPRWEPER